MIEALEYSEDDFDRATMAAGVLGEMKPSTRSSPSSAPPTSSCRSNRAPTAVRLAAIRALVKIGDPRPLPLLAKILTTSANEQDFLLNQKAALGLAELRDPSSIPFLLKACS